MDSSLLKPLINDSLSLTKLDGNQSREDFGFYQMKTWKTMSKV